MATRWGCVGAGFVTSDFFTAIRETLPLDEHKFVAIAARDKDRAQKYADKLSFKKAYGSYDDLVNDPDVEIAYIGILPNKQAEMSIKLMNAGKHVLCETPMAINLKIARMVFEAAKQNNVFFMQGIWSRFTPVYQQVRKELSEKTLGTIKLLRAEMCLSVLEVERLQKLELGGGGLENFGIYPVALACMVFGEMPESIKAVGNITPTGVDETVCIMLKYKNGAIANLTISLTVNGENTAFIFGEGGNIKIESPMWAPTTVITPSGTYEYPIKERKYNYPNGSAFQYEATAIRKYLISGAKEAAEIPHSQSEMILTIMDEVRRQIGVVFPED